MGIVLSRSLASEFEEVIPTAGYRGRGFSSGQGERKFLFRLANAEERAALVMKVQDEERALEVNVLSLVLMFLICALIPLFRPFYRSSAPRFWSSACP
jgi:hypothetical protein